VFGYPPLLFFLGEKTKGTPTLLGAKGPSPIMLKYNDPNNVYVINNQLFLACLCAF